MTTETLTDLEMTRLSAEAMGLPLMPHMDGDERCFLQDPANQHSYYPVRVYWPLENDAQAMALVKKFSLCVDKVDGKWGAWERKTDSDGFSDELNRAIVECVAKMQAERATDVSIRRGAQQE
jgi:hypothetical protein